MAPQMAPPIAPLISTNGTSNTRARSAERGRPPSPGRAGDDLTLTADVDHTGTEGYADGHTDEQ